MPLDTPNAVAPSAFHLDREANLVRFERRLRASPEQAFDAWTKPEQIAAWWDPNGRPLASCKIDLRVGGEFLFTMADHHPFGGVYQRIDRPHCLVFTAMGSTGTVLFAPAEGGAQITVTIACDTAEQLQGFLAMGVAEGTSVTLDNLVAFLA